MLKIILLILIVSSCSSMKGVKKEDKLEGVWVPVKIEWKSAVEGDQELEGINHASFYIFSFAKSEFILVGSTNAPGDNDSLIIASEPGYSLYYGKWEMRDSIVLTKYKKVYSFLNLPGDTMMLKERVDTLILRNEILIFNSEPYKPYTNTDTGKISRFWRQAKEAK